MVKCIVYNVHTQHGLYFPYSGMVIFMFVRLLYKLMQKSTQETEKEDVLLYTWLAGSYVVYANDW